MTRLLLVGGAVLVAAFILVNLAWRWSSQRWHLPCPTWLAWGLSNSLAARLLATEATLDRLQLVPGMQVLEMGSGPGRLLVPAAHRVLPGGQVVGLDLQPGMTDRLLARAAAEGLQNVAGITGDAATTEHAPVSFDLVFLSLALGEIPDRNGALRQAWRALRPGGRLCIAEMFPDPHFVPQGSVRSLAGSVGFVHERTQGRPWLFTASFLKPDGARE